MSRFGLIAAGFLLLLLAACSDNKPVPAESGGFDRVNAAKPAAPAVPVGWCDLEYSKGEPAPTFELPPFHSARKGEKAPAFPNDKWVWVNFWATWCKPCKKEMPYLIQWKDRLASEGQPFDLWFVSVDESEEDLTKFIQGNPQTTPGPSIRVKKPDEFPSWLKLNQLDGASSVPIHFLIRPGGKIRCIRAGAINESDINTLRALMQ